MADSDPSAFDRRAAEAAVHAKNWTFAPCRPRLVHSERTEAQRTDVGKIEIRLIGKIEFRLVICF